LGLPALRIGAPVPVAAQTSRQVIEFAPHQETVFVSVVPVEVLLIRPLTSSWASFPSPFLSWASQLDTMDSALA